MRLFRKQRTLDLLAPATGTVLDLSAVPDPVFAEAVLGPGFAISPTDGVVVSPVAATIAGVLPSRHAIYLETADGVQVLIHVGLETVKLNGRHFDVLVSAGEDVEAGQPLIEWDREAVAKAGYGTDIPVCLTDLGPYSTVQVLSARDEVSVGQRVAVAREA